MQSSSWANAPLSCFNRDGDASRAHALSGCGHGMSVYAHGHRLAFSRRRRVPTRESSEQQSRLQARIEGGISSLNPSKLIYKTR